MSLSTNSNRFVAKLATSLTILFTMTLFIVHAQHTVTLTAQYATPNNCNPRVLTASVSGGSGNFTYFWTSQPSSGANLGNTPSITVSPSQTTTYTSGVFDNVTGQFATASVTIGRIISGSFNVFIPNVITPNGDGFNDIWQVADGNQSMGPINAYQYSLTIVNRFGSSVMSGSGSVTTGTEGLLGGQIFWNGRINNTGNFVSNGVYYYSVILTNCSGSQNFQGSISVLGSPGSLAIYPNPATTVLNVALVGEEATDTNSIQEISDYEIVILSKNGRPLIQQRSNKKTTPIDITMLPKDTYILQVDFQGDRITRHLSIDR